ncbi:DUF4097 family beta strand repeat-containing protein [Streptomyces sp. NPDC058637]|uniref:DUF4097 family beta strand repeat-containing protein n=1 Tax=Streptomyces sp. NPDC058637 TaxID=3346569 RepID=UPI003651645A
MTSRTRIHTLVATGATALLLVALSGCGAGADDAPVERKAFPYSGKNLTIDSGNSTVDVVPADVERIEVTRRVDGWVVFGSGPDPFWKLEGDKLTLGVKCSAVISDCDAHHEVKVPRGTVLTVDSDNGTVTASGFDTALTLSSDNGEVLVRDSSGPLDLETDNGSVVAERVSAASVVARSSNGEVELGFSEVPDLVDTVTDNGSITIDLPRSGGAYAVSTSTDNGDVHVGVPRSDSSKHVVKARSSNGEVTVRTAN